MRTGMPVILIALSTAMPALAQVRLGDWPQWGGPVGRNNTPAGRGIPVDWNVGRFDNRTGEWLPAGSKNIRWAVRLGSQTYGTPVIANGQVYVGTNNGRGYLSRFPLTEDLG